MNWLEELTTWGDVGCGGGRALKGVVSHMAFSYLQSAILGAVEVVPFQFVVCRHDLLHVRGTCDLQSKRPMR